jgi:hypothetical protein
MWLIRRSVRRLPSDIAIGNAGGTGFGEELMKRAALFAGAVFACAPALANDTTAKLDTGGLLFGKSYEISMEKEELFISPEKITVDYVFRNQSDKDVTTIVAFPMPDIVGGPYTMQGIPDDTSDNFLDFSVTMNGLAITPQLQQRVIAAGIDVTDDLVAKGIPLMPHGEEVVERLRKLTEDVRADWISRGIVIPNEYDGAPEETLPFWTLRSAYWWEATFPAGEAVPVSHVYKPSLGGTAGVSFYFDGKFNEHIVEYEHTYCTDAGFKRAVERAAKANPDGYAPYTEMWISYVLTTGGNWALGTIGDFTLTIDKGSPDNIVSFCGEGVKKIGPTTFQMKAKDYYPERDVNVLILQPYDLN